VTHIHWWWSLEKASGRRNNDRRLLRFSPRLGEYRCNPATDYCHWHIRRFSVDNLRDLMADTEHTIECRLLTYHSGPGGKRRCRNEIWRRQRQREGDGQLNLLMLTPLGWHERNEMQLKSTFQLSCFWNGMRTFKFQRVTIYRYTSFIVTRKMAMLSYIYGW